MVLKISLFGFKWIKEGFLFIIIVNFFDLLTKIFKKSFINFSEIFTIILNNIKETDMKDTITVEIRAAEGGLDSKLLVNDQFNIYKNYCDKRCL